MKQGGLTLAIILAILAAILIIGGVSYCEIQKSSVPVATNTQPNNTHLSDIQQTTKNVASSTVNTTGWKNYSNAEYRISFKYPPEWTMKATSTPGIGNIVLDKDGYSLVIQICNSTQSCYEIASHPPQEFKSNTTLSAPVSLSLNIDGQQVWRTVGPVPNGEGDDTLYFNFTFLRKTEPTTDSTGFNDKSRFTPVSILMERNAIFYAIDYRLPGSTTQTNYDHSIISQMDGIVQSMAFTR